MNRHLSLRLLCLLAAGAWSEPAPAPGRVPKVYNALITSNQNLEPSKAYPVYQPVLHEAAFTFPFQPAVFLGDFPINNGLLPPSALLPSRPDDPNVAPSPAPSAPPAPPAPPADPQPEVKTPSSEAPPPPEESTENNDQSTPAPPPPPKTESPIPLNEFGLPPQVLPLGRIDPAYSGFSQVGPFTYTYPSLRFYDPYDPFSLTPYGNFPPPLYRPLTNVLGPSGPVLPQFPLPQLPVQPQETPASAPTPTQQSQPGQSPPQEPSDLNVLNYSSKDPAIPNVPPPPLPQGGLKSDDSE